MKYIYGVLVCGIFIFIDKRTRDGLGEEKKRECVEIKLVEPSQFPFFSEILAFSSFLSANIFFFTMTGGMWSPPFFLSV